MYDFAFTIASNPIILNAVGQLFFFQKICSFCKCLQAFEMLCPISLLLSPFGLSSLLNIQLRLFCFCLDRLDGVKRLTSSCLILRSVMPTRAVKTSDRLFQALPWIVPFGVIVRHQPRTKVGCNHPVSCNCPSMYIQIGWRYTVNS